MPIKEISSGNVVQIINIRRVSDFVESRLPAGIRIGKIAVRMDGLSDGFVLGNLISFVSGRIWECSDRVARSLMSQVTPIVSLVGPLVINVKLDRQ